MRTSCDSTHHQHLPFTPRTSTERKPGLEHLAKSKKRSANVAASARTHPTVHTATLQRQNIQSRPHEGQDSGEVTEKENYNWSKQWYPLAAIKDYATDRPHAEMLLGQKVVLWYEKATAQWRCFEDQCPHRLVPLSEGRIDDATGNLMCGYHGWTFDGTGKLADVPQLRSKGPKAMDAITANPRSCAKSRPVQVLQGLIFVWGESGPSALEESQATDPAISNFREQEGEENIFPFFDQYIRDLPGNFEVWTENMQDQSHVAFAHHGVAGKRGGEKEGYFHMLENDRHPHEPEERGAAFKTKFEWTANGKSTSTTALYFMPPCLSGFRTEKGSGSLYVYAVPISANATRLIINAVAKKRPEGGSSKVMNLAKSFFPNYLRSVAHLTLNKVNQGDAVFMTGQHRVLGRTSSQPSQTNKYFLATEADGGTATFNAWLKNQGGSGPKFSEPPLTEASWWNASGKLKREQVLDNWTQHTSKCASCQKVLSDVEKGQKACKILGTCGFLALVGLLGQGQLPWSIPGLISLLLMGASAIAYSKLSALQTRFHYEPWSQADMKH